MGAALRRFGAFVIDSTSGFRHSSFIWHVICNIVSRTQLLAPECGNFGSFAAYVLLPI